jgi:hypothetical protein
LILDLPFDDFAIARLRKSVAESDIESQEGGPVFRQ